MFLVIDLIHSHHKINKNLKMNSSTNKAIHKMKIIIMEHFLDPLLNSKLYLTLSKINSQ
jgi:hypothetical protein